MALLVEGFKTCMNPIRVLWSRGSYFVLDDDVVQERVHAVAAAYCTLLS